MTWFVAALVIGQLALAAAGVILARAVQTLQVDARRPGRLVERTDQSVRVVRPPELERAERLIDNALASETIAAGELLAELVELAARAPGQCPIVPPPGSDRRRWLDSQLNHLEEAWGLVRGTDYLDR